MHVGAGGQQSPAVSPQPEAATSPVLTDSMKMFQMGLEGGRPEAGKIGAAPEWFYKGVGTILRATISRSMCPRTRWMAATKQRLPASI